MNLRSYQQESIDALFAYFQAKDGNPLLVMPTGSGKSVVLAFFLKKVFEHWPCQRVIVLTHVKELIRQNYTKLLETWPEAPAGINSAGIGRRDQRHPILFAGIQSVHKIGIAFDKFDLAIIDECHLIGRNRSSMYRQFLDDLWLQNPALKIIGMTATHFRMDSGLLTHGADRIFTDIAHEVPVIDLIDQGYLSKLISKPGATQADLNGVHTRRGDFIDSEADSAFSAILDAAIDEICTLGADRKAWLLFTHRVDSAADVAQRLRAKGIDANYVCGATPKDERDAIIASYKAGTLRALVNCAVLTTGFDAPQTDLLVFLRATQSVGLYVQICGRAMRVAPGKDNAMILDYGGNIARHGPLDAITIKTKAGSSTVSVKKLPTRTCPECMSIVKIFERTCPDCGYQWPLVETNINDTASSEAILAGEAIPQWLQVTGTYFSRHTKEGKPDSVKFSYTDGYGYICSDWLCVAHGGFARRKALEKLAGFVIEQSDFDELLDHGMFNDADSLLKILDECPDGFQWPTRIKVKKLGKYYEVLDYEFNDSASAGAERNDQTDSQQAGSREYPVTDRDDSPQLF